MYGLLAQSDSLAALDHVIAFLRGGGIFMIFILLCSLVAMGVVLHRLMSLRWGAILPREITFYINRLKETQDTETLAGLGAVAGQRNSPLGRVVSTAFDLRDEDSETLRHGVEASAREEVVNMQSGLAILEVVITIAPLLGLLGTVSGLIGVFGIFGETDANTDPDPARVAAGIAEALNTTIGGLAVAVPVVVAHSYINKKIERMAVRMEVLLNDVIQSLQRIYMWKDEREDEVEEQADEEDVQVFRKKR